MRRPATRDARPSRSRPPVRENGFDGRDTFDRIDITWTARSTDASIAPVPHTRSRVIPAADPPTSTEEEGYRLDQVPPACAWATADTFDRSLPTRHDARRLASRPFPRHVSRRFAGIVPFHDGPTASVTDDHCRPAFPPERVTTIDLGCPVVCRFHRRRTLRTGGDLPTETASVATRVNASPLPRSGAPGTSREPCGGSPDATWPRDVQARRVVAGGSPEPSARPPIAPGVNPPVRLLEPHAA